MADLLGGRVVRLRQGDYDDETVYGDDPVAQARFVAERRILRPNSKQPFEDVDELLNLETDELIVDRLAMKKPDGEIVLHARAQQELLPYFVANQLGLGAMGLVVIGILAVSMASSSWKSMCSASGTLALGLVEMTFV